MHLIQRPALDPTIDLGALITLVPPEATETLAQEVKEHVDALVQDFCHDADDDGRA